MNRKQLIGLGMRADLSELAVDCLRAAADNGYFRGITSRKVVKRIMENPLDYINNEHFGKLAEELIKKEEPPYVPEAPIPYKVWGEDIDANSRAQMDAACQLPVSVAGALMPDAHLGYGLPIGGVLATEDCVIPYAVGVDISCSMKISILDLPTKQLAIDQTKFEQALEQGTVFGVGGKHKNKHNHPVMDADWKVSNVTRQMKDCAWSQLGTSGSGNHFVEFGIMTLDHDDFGVKAGQYIALMSHSGSRGTGAQVCKFYSDVAKQRLPKKYEAFRDLAWLDMDTEAGQEYWAAMNLMAAYALANHACIHQMVSYLAGASVLATIENSHNLCWKEQHNGKELFVHRKGATPAGKGVLGVIPGSMADPAFVVRGKGNPDSLESASHGAGRCMGRKDAMRRMDWNHWKGVLRQRGVKLLSAGLDEVPGVYKDITKVIAAQTDLVEVVARFDPKIVKMSGDGSKAED